MRTSSFFAVFVFFWLLLVVPAMAQETYSDGSPKCEFDQEEKTVKLNELEDGETVESGNDDCVNETITLDIKAGTMTIKPTGSTRDKNDPNVCAERNTCTEKGKVTFFCGKGGQSFTIAKDEPGDFEKKITQCVAGESLTPQDIAARDLAEEAITIDSPNEQLQSVLEAFGVPKAAAQQAIASNKEGVVDLLQKAAAGDVLGAREAAKELNLNENLFNDVATLTPEDRLGKFASAMNDTQKQFAERILGSQTGFGSGAQTPPPSASDCDDLCRARRSIECIESYCGRSDAVGPVVCNRYGCGSAYGKHQVMWFNIPSWTATWCGRSYSTGEFLADESCQDRVFNGQFGGYVSSCGSYTGAASKWFSGSCNGGGGDGYLSTSNYVRKFAGYFNGGEIPEYTGGGSPFGGGANPRALGGSPFQRLTPLFSSRPVGVSGPTGVPGGGIAPSSGQPRPAPSSGAPSSGSVSTPRPAPVSSGSSGQSIGDRLRDALLPTGSTAESGPVEPEAAILAQPQTIVRGKTILLSWSSVGMSVARPCRVTVSESGQESLIAEANEGSQTIKVSATTTPGEWQFSLSCTTLAENDPLKRDTSITVE